MIERQTNGWEIARHGRPVQTIRFSPVGGYWLTGDVGRTLRIWREDHLVGELDLRTRNAKAETSDRIRSAAFSPDGLQFYVASGPTLQAFRTEDGRRLWSCALPRFLGFLIAAPLSVDANAAGQVAAANDNGTFGIRDSLGRKLRQWKHNASPRWLRWTSDGERLIGSDSFSIRKWDAMTGETLQGYTSDERVYGMDASRAAPFFVTRTLHAAHLYHLLWSSPIATVPVAEGLPLVALDPSGNRFAASSEHRVALYGWSGGDEGEPADCRQKFETESIESAILALSFSADGSRLVAGCSDGTVRAWAVPPEG